METITDSSWPLKFYIGTFASYGIYVNRCAKETGRGAWLLQCSWRAHCEWKEKCSKTILVIMW